MKGRGPTTRRSRGAAEEGRAVVLCSGEHLGREQRYWLNPDRDDDEEGTAPGWTSKGLARASLPSSE